MKTLLKTLYILTLSFCILNSASAQYNAANGILGIKAPNVINISKVTTMDDIDTASAACNALNYFWGTDAVTAELKAFALTNNVITYTGSSISTCPGYSLAICNNINGGAVSPTFYTSINNIAYYWDGASSWVTADTINGFLVNAGGYDNNLYFLNNGGNPTTVIKYDGNAFNIIATIPHYSGMADIAVDAVGNFIFVSRDAGSFSDSVYIYSPSGQIIQQYPFVADMSNAYGCILMNGVFYIGLGNSNLVFPNTLLPITFTATAAIVGTPILFPPGNNIHNDLAGCNPGVLLGLNASPATEEFSLFPNPAKGIVSITTAAIPNTTYAIYDTEGRIVVTATAIKTSSTTINVSHLKKGIYFTEIKNEKGVVRKKFAKM